MTINYFFFFSCTLAENVHYSLFILPWLEYFMIIIFIHFRMKEQKTKWKARNFRPKKIILRQREFFSLALVPFNLMHIDVQFSFLEWVGGKKNLIKCLRHVCQKKFEREKKENMSHPGSASDVCIEIIKGKKLGFSNSN